MKVHVSGEAAAALVEGAQLHSDTPADQLCRAINLLHFLEEQELAGFKIMVHDPEEDVIRHVLIGKISRLDDEDHVAMWDKELE